MKDTVKVAAAQMEVKWLDPEANLTKMKSFLNRIEAKGGVEIVVFPELCSSGYVVGRDKQFMRNYLRVAQKIPGPFTESLGEMARKHGTYIIAGILEEHPVVTATLYNTVVLIEPSGNILGVQRKLHIPSEEKHYFYPGSSLDVFPTDLGKVGMLICADYSFPESSRVLSLKGAEIICVSINRGKTVVDREQSIRVISCRAFENQNFFVACNRVGKENDLIFDGGSCIAGPNGDYIARSEIDTEDIVMGTLQAEMMSEMRTWTTRFRDRRPELYGPICQPF
jgi:predicted amidohydrolase